jgi:hypothetical protein
MCNKAAQIWLHFLQSFQQSLCHILRLLQAVPGSGEEAQSANWLLKAGHIFYHAQNRQAHLAEGNLHASEK